MKKTGHNKLLFIALLIVMIVMGACHDNEWDSVPTLAQRFITQYFPQGEVSSSQTQKDGTVVVQIKNGATLWFDSQGAWIKINGNGVPLPEILLYDQLPSSLYNFLQETEQTSDIYALTRTYDEIRVELHDTYVVYNIDKGTVNYPTAS